MTLTKTHIEKQTGIGHQVTPSRARLGRWEGRQGKIGTGPGVRWKNYSRAETKRPNHYWAYERSHLRVVTCTTGWNTGEAGQGRGGGREKEERPQTWRGKAAQGGETKSNPPGPSVTHAGQAGVGVVGPSRMPPSSRRDRKP